MIKNKPAVIVKALEREDMPFLFALWHNHDVMRYADEFPRYRGWSRLDEIEEAWEIYDAIRDEFGNKYTQLIIKLHDGSRIGESFFAPLEDEENLGEWEKPKAITTCIGDIKLLPAHWGKGFGTRAMREVVRFAFGRAGCGIFIVPPHKDNFAAIRVYEKTGFNKITARPPWANHILMTLTRKDFVQLHSRKKY